jgi:arsenate reductase (glutaredoxin)
MIEAWRAVDLTAATPEQQQIDSPSGRMGPARDSPGVVRAKCALEAVQDDEVRRRLRGRHAEQVEKVAIGRGPSLHVPWRQGNPAGELTPQSLPVCSGEPPRGREGDRRHTRHGVVGEGFVASRALGEENEIVEVQIFGIKKNADTRKALRFFSERRVKTHFVDFKERAASLGELKRFAQKFGIPALIDETSARFGELGLRHSRLTDTRWLELLVDEPLVLRMPMVRSGNSLTIGLAEDSWKAWLSKP